MMRSAFVIPAIISFVGCGALLGPTDDDLPGDASTSPPDAASPIDGAPPDDGSTATDAAIDGPPTLLRDVKEIGTSAIYPNPVGLAVGASDLFVSAENGVILVRGKGVTPTDLGAPIYTGLDGPRHLALFNSDIFWCETAGNSIERGATDGGAEGRITVAVAIGATGLAIGGETVWASDPGNGTLYSMMRDGTFATAATAATVLPSEKPEGVAIAGGLVYVALRGSTEVVSFAIGNPSTTRTHVFDVDAPAALAFDEVAGVLYVTSQSSDSSKRGLYRWNKGDANAELVVPTTDVPAGVAFDETYVYWVTRGSAGRIWRAEK